MLDGARAVAIFGCALAYPSPAFSHPDAETEAGMLAYLISAVIVAGLALGTAGAVRLWERRSL